MHVIVIGLGQVGRHVTRRLEQNGHDIVAIDSDPEALAWISEQCDVMTLQGFGASPTVLARARCEQAGLVIAVTNDDEVNLLAAISAKRLGAKRAVARVKRSDWAPQQKHQRGIAYNVLGVDVIFNPAILLAHEITNIAQSHGALDVIDIASDRIDVAQMALGEQGHMLRKPLSEITLPKGVLIGAIVRAGELRVPGGADVLLPKDRIYLIGHPQRVLEAEDRFSDKREARRVCIFGGGMIGTTLAEELKPFDTRILIIEPDRQHAEDLAVALSHITVLHGDATDLGLLEEEEIHRYDLFAAVSDNDEENLMAGLLAKRLGVERVVSIVQRPDYMPIYQNLGIDVVLSPRIVASEHILQYFHQAGLQSVTPLEGGKAELLEFIISADCANMNLPVRKMNIPRGALMCAILRGERTIVPSGDDTIEAGDHVILLTTPSARAQATRLFQSRTN
jgi:trk system potassium uptake protein TrkA